MALLEIVVEAGHHGREFCPVCADVALSPEELDGCALVDKATGVAVPFQAESAEEGARIYWIVDSLAAGQRRVYALAESTERPLAADVGVEPEEDGLLSVKIAGQLFTNYHFSDQAARPFLYPVIGPFGAGVTRGFPMEAIEGEPTDHPHHKSIYVAWGDVNGSDNWSEEEGSGRVVHRDFERCEGGPVCGVISSRNDWVDACGRKLMEDRTQWRFYNLPPSAKMFDLEVTFYATEGDVRFGDTKEGGIISARVAAPMQANRLGRIENAVGGIGEAETWGKRACWCDYSGPVVGHWVGLAVFDHPSNFRYPTYWHVRNYGLMTANPFGLSYFLDNKDADGSYVLPRGGELRFRYRVYVHAGDAAEGKVAQKYLDWVFPPTATVQD